MKKTMTTLACLLAAAAQAETAWISDALQTSVSDKPDVNGQYLGSLTAGESVQLLEMSKDGRYAHIKTAKLDGWVWSRNIQKTPSLQMKFAEQQKALEAAQAENSRLQASSLQASSETAALRSQLSEAQHNAEKSQQDLASLQQSLSQVQNQNAQLSSTSQNASAAVEQLRAQLAQAQDSAQKSRAELVALQRAGANVVQIDARNRELQAQVVSLEQENLNLRHSNARLEESQSHKQMTIGGLLVLSGVMLSWLFGLMHKNRSRRAFSEL